MRHSGEPSCDPMPPVRKGSQCRNWQLQSRRNLVAETQSPFVLEKVATRDSIGMPDPGDQDQAAKSGWANCKVAGRTMQVFANHHPATITRDPAVLQPTARECVP